jgi:hypothetical protein
MKQANSRISLDEEWSDEKGLSGTLIPYSLVYYKMGSLFLFLGHLIREWEQYEIIFCITFSTGVLHLIQINHKPDAKISQFNILKFVYSSTCLWSFPAHHQELNNCSGSFWFYLLIVVIVVLCLWSARPAGWPDHEHSTTVTTCKHPSNILAGISASRIPVGCRCS